MEKKLGRTKIDLNKEEIIRLSLGEKKSCAQIGIIFNVNGGTIHNRLKEYGINTSKIGKPLIHLKKYQFTSEQIRERNLKNNPSRRKDLDYKRIVELYNKGLKWSELQKIFNCSVSPIRNALKKDNVLCERKKKTYEEIYGIERADEIRKKISRPLERNPNWQEGKSYEPYTKEFTPSFRELIRQRDGFLCLKCGMREEDSLVLFKRKLHIHHVDYDKQLTILENCCALCQRCNSEVNFNRPHWTKFFQSLLSERYSYQYSNDGKIIFNLNEEIKNE